MVDPRTMLAIVLSIMVAAIFHARADGPVNPSVSGAQIAALWAAMPQPADAIPPTDTLNGAIGSSLKYMRQDAPRPTISQRTTVTTNGTGNWSVSWNKNFLSSNPVVVPTPLSAGTGKPNCKTQTVSAGAASGYCWVENVQPALVSVLGINVLSGVTVSSDWAAGSVMLVGLEPSQ